MTNINFALFNRWQEYYYNLDNNLLSTLQIGKAINTLFENFVSIDSETLISIQFKVKLDNNQFRSLSYLQTVTLNQREDLIEIFNEFLNIRDDEYYSLNITHIVFTYKLISSDTLIRSKINRSIKLSDNYNENDKEKGYNFIGYNLPCTMDYTRWGRVIIMTDDYAKVQKLNSNSIYSIKISEQELQVALTNKNNIILEFKDKLLENGKLNSFQRIIKNQEYIFIDGKCVLKKIIKQTKFIKPILMSSFMSKKFLTMDLETRNIGGILTPYAISIYDGNNKISYYLGDFSDSSAMITTAIKFLMKPKYHNYKIYMHNFSFFDSIFILKILSQLTNKIIKPIIRDGRIIDLKFRFCMNNKNVINLYFRDAYLLLPSSLAKLAINFNVENKAIFPYNFINNPNISLNYDGEVPSIDKFNNLSLSDYSNYCQKFLNKTWNLKNETIKYCEQDVVTLYLILEKFQITIFNLFRLDILKYPTLSSLAFAIYRSNFMGEAKIPIIDGNLFKQIKKGYTGGSVDVFKPYGENIYRYDVNSLYPFVMKNYPMPVDTPIYFEGDISKISEGSGYNLLDKPFGFFEVEVVSPSNIKIPLLQKRIKTQEGIRTMAPLGEWTGTYFSEEIYNTMNYGYKFKILRGVLFKKGFIFKDYVDVLFKLKLNSKKGSPNYIISKLLLNSLYGRFGMNPICEKHLIINSKYSLKYLNENIITNVIDFKNGKELISFFDENEWSEAKSKNNLNISISISAAVTSCARIFMNQFKTMKDVLLYYMDTDSIDIDKPLNNNFVGSELGLMKLEHIFDKAIFLAPKVYGGVTSDYEYVRVKGLKNTITFDEIKPLLNKNYSLKIPQEKWYRNVSEGNINIKQEIYTLMIKNYKRKLIYDVNNKFIDTSPIHLSNYK